MWKIPILYDKKDAPSVPNLVKTGPVTTLQYILIITYTVILVGIMYLLVVYLDSKREINQLNKDIMKSCSHPTVM